MSWLSKLFGGKADGAAAPADGTIAEDYKGLRITPDPIREGQVWRIAARITGQVDGATQ